MKTTAFIDLFGIKASSICTDCAAHKNHERYLISSIGLEQTHGLRGTKRGGTSRLFDILSLTT